MSIPKKISILTAIAVVGFIGYMVVLRNSVNAIAEAQNEFKASVTQDQCQYPMRPLVNGKCDNSDPAVPECIKSENEAECAKQYNNTPEPEPVKVEPKPVNQCNQ